MKYFTSAFLAGAAVAQKTVTVFEGLPPIDMTEPNVEAINEWAAGVEGADQAINAEVVAAWDAYVAAVQAPLKEFLSELETASNEKDKLAAQSLADILKYAGDNAFVNGEDSLAEVFPQIGETVDYLNAYDPAAPPPQPYVLTFPAYLYNYETGVYEIVDCNLPEDDYCKYDSRCWKGYEDHPDWDKFPPYCVNPDARYTKEAYYNYEYEYDMVIDVRDPGYDPCEFDYNCYRYGDDDYMYDRVPRKKNPLSPWQIAVKRAYRESMADYGVITTEYKQAMAQQAQEHVRAAEAAVVDKISETSAKAQAKIDVAAEQEIANIHSAEEFLTAKIGEVAGLSQQQIDDALAKASSAEVEFEEIVGSIETIDVPVTGPRDVVLQSQVPLDATSAPEEPSVKDQLKEKLSEKAGAYAELEREYRNSVKAQFEADVAAAQEQLSAKLSELSSAIDEAAADLKSKTETITLAKKTAVTTASEGTGYSAAIVGSIGLAAVLGFAAYTAAKRNQKVIEPLIKTESDEEYQQA